MVEGNPLFTDAITPTLALQSCNVGSIGAIPSFLPSGSTYGLIAELRWRAAPKVPACILARVLTNGTFETHSSLVNKRNV
jgi:hypothetical protein